MTRFIAVRAFAKGDYVVNAKRVHDRRDRIERARQRRPVDLYGRARNGRSHQ